MEKRGGFWERFLSSIFSLLFCVILNFVLYSYMQEYTLHRSEVSEFLALSLDKAIPFVPFFVWVYVSYWALIGMPFFADVVPEQFYITGVYLRFWRRKLNPRRKFARKLVRYGSRCMRWMGLLGEFVFGRERERPLVRKRKFQTVLAYLCVIAVSNLVYFLYPLKVIRPEIHNSENPIDMTMGFLRALYEHDRPNNTLPSQHAAFSTLAFFIFNYLRDTPVFFYLVFPWRKVRQRIPISVMGGVIGLWAFLIILSTYFIKQHVIADSIAGIAVAYLAFKLGFSERVHAFFVKCVGFFVKKEP